MSDLNIPASLLPCFPVLGKLREANREAELRENAFIFSLKQGSREAGKRVFSKLMLGTSQEAILYQPAQLSFWEIDVAKIPPRRLGVIGEEVAYNLFERAGYVVNWVNQKSARRGDLRVVDTSTGEFWRVEVKAARRGCEGHWQFSLRRRVGARICTDVAHADYVLLLAFPVIGNPVMFLIPVGALGEMKQLSFASAPDAYAGKWAKFRVNELKLGGLEHAND